MSYGMMISASGALAAMYRQDVLAANLANMDTIGFKPDFAAARQRDAARVEDGLSQSPSDGLLESLGSGLLMAPNRTRFTQGSLRVTGQVLDLAIEGDGFFTVSGDGGGPPLLTRDGRFVRAADGRVVMASTGRALVDERGRGIVVPDSADVSIDGLGTVRVGVDKVGRIGLVDTPGRDRLQRLGDGLYAPPADQPVAEATGTIRSGVLEESAVDEVQTMMGIASAASAFAANLSMIQAHDRLNDRAIASLGRVS